MIHQDIYRIRVAVAVPLYTYFDYQIHRHDFEHACIGARVIVPFGSQRLVGIILEKFEPDVKHDYSFKLKWIYQLLDRDNIFGDSVFQLLKWMSLYYHYPLGEVFYLALPALLRQGQSADILSHHWKALDSQHFLKILTQKQKEAYEIIKLHPNGCSEDILNASGINSITLKQLLKKNAVSLKIDTSHQANDSDIELAQLPLSPNSEQQYAINQVLKYQNQYHGFLLDGLTGSGKTEVYLQIMYEILKQGRQVLVLVPEIGLTPQTIYRFQHRFRTKIAILHSGLSDSKRLQAWQQAKSGQAKIILGTRSAIFTPFKNLGLIILDEEHDLSYKQQDSLRYHARDVALYRAHMQNCPIILGSATPSVECYYLAEQKKLTILELNQRAGMSQLPQLHTIDLKKQKKIHGISEILCHKIKETLQKNEQVLIFVNRRGYAPVLFCENCAWQADCPRCDAHFTIHTQPYQHLRCHHCGLIYSIPYHCPACESQQLKPLGIGTNQIEFYLKSLFPHYPIFRIDRDSTHNMEDWGKLYHEIQKNEPLILIGTQMLSKGHHFPFVTLVGILDIDSGFFSVDFRAPERMAQQIIQVSGRAGRIHKKGEVYLQTYKPDHPMLNILIQKNYRAFAQHCLKERQMALFPPFTYAALIRVSSKSEQYHLDLLKQIQNTLNDHQQNAVRFLGPIPAPMARKAGYHQAHLLLLAKNRHDLHHLLNQHWSKILSSIPKQFNLRISLDIDPQELD